MSWAKIPRLVRRTDRRGRAAVPTTFARTRRRRLRRRCSFVLTVMGAAPRTKTKSSCLKESRSDYSCALPDLPGHVLALVADALALVGLRRALLADVGRDLADDLLGDALDHDARGLRHLEGDALRRLDRHRVRVAQRKLEVASLELRAVADALDLERLGEADRDALDHVRDQRARQAVQGAVLGAVGRTADEQLPVLLDDLDRAVLALLEVAPRPGHAHDLGLDGDGDGRGDVDGLLTDTGHCALPD